METPVKVTSHTSTLRAFVFVAYGLTWVLLVPWFYAVTAVYHGEIPNWLWALAPVAFVGGWGPTVAALMVAARTGGRVELRRLLGTNTAESVLVGGLPRLSAEQQRTVSLVSVALLAILGVVSLARLARRRPKPIAS